MIKCPQCEIGNMKTTKYQGKRKYMAAGKSRKERAVLVCQNCQHREVFV